jgi:outer membrane protein OmpA-like peptidoglycan-associated protein
MKRLSILSILAGAALAGAVASPAAAQTAKPKVLDDSQVTEKTLVDALAPTPEDLAAIRTRSLRVGPAAAGTAGAQAGTQAGAAGAQVATPDVAPPRKDVSLLVTFVTNSATLTTRARELLDIVARALKSDQLASLKFTVEGHADPRGNPQANLALSQSRADSVRVYLIEKHGIGGDRLIAVGKGDRELMNRAVPAAPENRRVTLVTRLN